MNALEQYRLELKSLPIGEHEFSFVLDNNFFKAIEEDEIKEGNVSATISVEKTAHNITLNIDLLGEVTTICDRCLDPLTIEVDALQTLYIKFGESYQEESDDQITIPEDEAYFDISWILYEYVALSLPLKKVHPENECNPEMIKILHQHEGTIADTKTTETNKVDPRWASLKDIIS